MKFEGSIIREVSGFVKLPFSTQRAVEAKERTADAIANGLILKDKGRPALKYVGVLESASNGLRGCCRRWSPRTQKFEVSF